MQNDLKFLAKFTKELAEKIKVGSKELTKEVAKELVETLVDRTPVDTSLAVSNWQASLDRPNTSEINAYFEGNKGSTRRVSSDAAIKSADSNIDERKDGQDIYVTNNVDYIDDLNNGHSSQAPTGFIENSILNAKKMIKYEHLVKDRVKVK